MKTLLCKLWSATVTFRLNVYYVYSVSSYGTPLTQRASYLALHSSLFEPDGAVDYDYIALTLC